MALKKNLQPLDSLKLVTNDNTSTNVRVAKGQIFAYFGKNAAETTGGLEKFLWTCRCFAKNNHHSTVCRESDLTKPARI